MSAPDEKIPLRQGIAELFAEDALDPRRLAELRRLASGAPARPDRRRWLGIAAGVVAAAGLGLWALRRADPVENVGRLAEEIAYNHLRYASASGEPLDAEGSSVAELRPTFAGLGFALVEPPPDEVLQGAELLGGRFCTLAMAPAVQLRFRSPRGEVTVCEQRYDAGLHEGVPDLATAAPAVLHARGVRVSLCHHQGVLLGVALA